MNKFPQDFNFDKYIYVGHTNLTILYVIFLASFLFPFLYFFGGLLAFIYSNDDKISLLGSHYSFLFQTFYKSFIYFLVILALSALISWTTLFAMPIIYILTSLRIIIGFKYYYQQRTYPNPDTWLL